jgi:hypothetical protein
MPKSNAKSKENTKSIDGVPNLITPSTIFDLLNFRIAEFVRRAFIAAYLFALSCNFRNIDLSRISFSR